MKYRREIDGLRAVAVVPVILFHAGFTPFAGGYVGVDIFFVISGYLITSILIEDLENDSFSFVRFYERRARRILPALFFMMLCCLPFAWFWILPSQFKDFSQALVAVSLFTSNILFWKKTEYFAPAADENPLLHTWSLAVEEQFYIIFPPLLLLLWRFRRSQITSIIIVLSLMSLALSEWAWRNAPGANFYLIVTRAWELGAGAICAFVLHRRQVPASAAFSCIGLSLIIFSIFFYDSTTPFPSLYALVPVSGAALVILFAGSKTLVARVLSLRAFVAVGLISYSAYLWHQPLFAFARIRSLGHVKESLMLTLIAASFLIGWLSWRYIERPFRRFGGALPSKVNVFSASLAGISAFVVIGSYGYVSDIQTLAWEKGNPDQREVYHTLSAAQAEQRGPLPTDSACRFSAAKLNDEVLARLYSCNARYGAGLAIIGDSHARDLYRGYFQVLKRPFLFALVNGGCRPYESQPNCDLEAFASLVVQTPNLFSEIHYTQAGFHLLETTSGDRGRSILSEVDMGGVVDPGRFRSISDRLRAVGAYLALINQQVHVVWIGPRIEPHISQQAIVRLGCSHNFELRVGQREIFETLDHTLKVLAAQLSLTYVSQIDSVNFDMSKDFMTCQHLYWSDSDHWTKEGAERFVKRLMTARPIPLTSE